MNRSSLTMFVFGIAACLVTMAWAEAPAQDSSPAKLRAEMHRTMADLIEARAQTPQPQQLVEQLTMKLESLRSRIAKSGGSAGAGLGGPNCPYGRGGGKGLGRGPCGMGQGWGRGAGRGQGYGRGWGRGAGRGSFYVDKNDNGICDNAESR